MPLMDAEDRLLAEQHQANRHRHEEHYARCTIEQCKATFGDALSVWARGSLDGDYAGKVPCAGMPQAGRFHANMREECMTEYTEIMAEWDRIAAMREQAEEN